MFRPLFPPSPLAREGLRRTAIRGPRWEALSCPGKALPGCPAAVPLPTSPASGRGDFACPSVSCMRFLHRIPFAPPPRRTWRTMQMAALTPPRRTRRTMQMAALTPPRRTRRTMQMAALTPPRRTRRTLQMAALTPPPPAGPASGTLFRAYRVWARAGVRAGAVRAPDCACARKPGRRAHLSRPFCWSLFRAGAKRPRGCRFHCSILALISETQARCGNYFKKYGTRSGFPVGLMPSYRPARTKAGHLCRGQK